MSEENVSVESDLNGVAESLLRSRPDLAEPNKLRLFEEMLDRQAAILHLADSDVLQDAASTDRAPVKMRPDEKFMSFVLHLAGSVLPPALVFATFPGVPLVLLPILLLTGFFGTRYLYRAERAQR